MGRARNPNRDKAHQLWIESQGKTPLKEIADQLGVSASTIRKWKSEDNWSGKSNRSAPKKIKERSDSKSPPKVFVESDAPEKRKLFALFYLQRFNATWAYSQAYGTDGHTSETNGSRMLRNAEVAKLIDDLKEEYLARVDITTQDAIAEYAKQAKSDIGDYLEFGTKTVIVRDGWYKPVKDKLTGDYLTQEVTYIQPKNSTEVDTSLIKSVHKGRDGFVLELYDKQKALDAIMKHVSKEHKDDDNLSIVIDIPKPPAEKGDAPHDNSKD